MESFKKELGINWFQPDKRIALECPQIERATRNQFSLVIVTFSVFIQG